MDFSLSGIWADLTHNWKGKVRRFRLHIFAFALFLTGLMEAVDPWALQSLLPDRWQSLVWVGYGIALWALRKATDHPVLVTTTFYAEEALTEAPQAAGRPDPTEGPATVTDPHAEARLDDDGAPHLG